MEILQAGLTASCVDAKMYFEDLGFIPVECVLYDGSAKAGSCKSGLDRTSLV